MKNKQKNCISCKKPINNLNSEPTKEGRMCFDCHCDYIIAKGGYKTLQ